MVDIYSKEMLYVGGEKEFIRPNLTDNGTMKGDSFAVTGTTPTSSSYAVYKAFDYSSSSAYRPDTTNGIGYITFYNPVAINVTKLILTFYSSLRFTVGTIKAGDSILGGMVAPGTTINSNVEYSTIDGNNTAIVTLSNVNYYKYYTINFTNANGKRLKDVQITATYKG